MEDIDRCIAKIDLSPEELTEDVVRELKKTAKNRNHESQFKIAYCYQYGLGVKKNLKKAFDLYTKAADAFIPEALNNLAVFYLNGIATSENFDKAFELFTKAAELGNVISQRLLAELYMGSFKDTEAALYWWEQAAAQNDANSTTWLASAYKRGIGHIKQDYKKARELYQKAAELGSAIAADNLAHFYQDGLGGEKNSQEAVYWFEKAVSQDYAPAKHHLALLYENGFLFCHPACRKKVISLLIEAANQDLHEAVLELFRIYQDSDIPERKDIDIDWLNKTAKRVMDKEMYCPQGGFLRADDETGIFNV